MPKKLKEVHASLYNSAPSSSLLRHGAGDDGALALSYRRPAVVRA
jgi:hypothetical protein